MRESQHIKNLRRTHDIIRRGDLIVDRGRAGHPTDVVRWYGADSSGVTPWQRADIWREPPGATWTRVDRWLREGNG